MTMILSKYNIVKKAIMDATLEERLLKAIEFNNPQIIPSLIKAGVDVNTDDDWPIIAASIQGSTDIVKMLIDAGANIHTDDDYPLQGACEKGFIDTVKVLLEAGANPHANGDYPLIIARQKGYTDILNLLQNQRMSLNFDTPSPNSIKKPKGPKEY